jgi:hypothetical protein
MDNFNLKKYLAENTLSQFGSPTAEELEMAKAEFSNAVLALDNDDPSTLTRVEEAYIALGEKLKNHLSSL